MVQAAARLGVATLLAAALTWTVAVPAGAQPLPGTSCSLFPADSVFNADVSRLPVNALSATWAGNMTPTTNLHPDFGTVAQQYGFPVNIAPPPSTGTTPNFGYDNESDHPAEGYPIDQSTLIEGGPTAPSGSDRHALVVDKNLCKLYELYNLQNFTNGQTPQAGSGAVWDLGSDAMRPDGWTSADAAGLPITPLLLRPDEILAGSVAHAIRFTAHCTHGYIWPGSHDAGSCTASFPPMGARFRLRAGYDISHFSASTQVVLRAFQHYGLVLADNGSDWYFQGTTDDWWGTSAGSTLVSELKTVPAGQFDAVDESSLQAAAGSYKASPGGGWGSLGGVLTSGPDASSSGAAATDVFVRGTDNGLWHAAWNGTGWGAWQSLGGVITSDPTAVSWGPGRIDVFARGTDNGLWQRTWNGSSWSPWLSLGGVLTSGPDVSSSGVNSLDVFVRGTDNGLWQRTWNGSAWSPWRSLGGVLTADPSAVSWGAGRIDVFVRGTDNGLWQRSWTGSAWSGWQSLGGVLTTGPDASSCASGHLDVYALGTDRGVWHRGWAGNWSAWQPLGGVWTSSPSAACRPSTTNVDLFERGTDAELWHDTVGGS